MLNLKSHPKLLTHFFWPYLISTFFIRFLHWFTTRFPSKEIQKNVWHENGTLDFSKLWYQGLPVYFFFLIITLSTRLTYSLLGLFLQFLKKLHVLLFLAYHNIKCGKNVALWFMWRLLGICGIVGMLETFLISNFTKF